MRASVSSSPTLYLPTPQLVISVNCGRTSQKYQNKALSRQQGTELIMPCILNYTSMVALANASASSFVFEDTCAPSLAQKIDQELSFQINEYP
jgi:hypothetical protein